MDTEVADSRCQPYDWAVIGSSPLCMMKAIVLARGGARVVVIEKNDRLGGMWSSGRVFGYDMLN
jgi:phytoene dehydrogenase-like protein